MDPIESMELKIKELESEIATLRNAIRTLRRGESQRGKPEMRFFDMRPLDAIVEVLKENEGRMLRSTLKDMLIRGGSTVGQKRGGFNIDISMDRNVILGNLIADGDYIALPAKQE